MNIFQIISFIIEFIFSLIFSMVFIFFPLFSLYNHVDSKPKTIRYVYLGKKKRKKNIGDIIKNLFLFALGIFFFIYFSLPYIMDLPSFVTGKLNYTTGKVYSTYTEDKDPFVYVHTEGKKLKFFFESGIEIGHSYKIGYLPHTRRGISIVELSDTPLKEEIKIGFPFKEILFLIGIIITLIGFLFLMYLSSCYLGLIPIIIASIVYYPIAIYSFFKLGSVTGIWFSLNNNGFLAIILGLVGLLLVLITYKVESSKSTHVENTSFFAQFIALPKIVYIIVSIMNFF